MKIPTVACARLPVDAGDFDTTVFDAYDGKEHVALTMGELASATPALVRIHSECFTGDVLGSHRCDCGEQLAESMRRIAQEGRGAILYLRQEGRGIGLAEKLRAYQLQDLGFDTVDANIELGHAPDARDYGVAASILRELGVQAVQLMTNNPAKVAALTRLGIQVAARVPLIIAPRPENRSYLSAKARRMGHLLDVPEAAEAKPAPPPATARAGLRLPERADELFDLLARVSARRERPFATLSYAQSLDGCSAAMGNRPLAISCGAARGFTHHLRAAHDAILVGIGTVLADDPRLTVREAEGADPQPIVVDSRLRFPLDAALLAHPSRRVWIATTPQANPARMRRLEALGAQLLVVPMDAKERVDLAALFALLRSRGIRNLMIEGGGRVLTHVVEQRLFDLLVLTIAPIMVGGTPALAPHQCARNREHTRLERPNYLQVGDDMVIWGAPQATVEGAREA
jgi:GTP cyclohydrolase II